MFGEAGEAAFEESFPQALAVSVVMRSFHCFRVTYDEKSRNNGAGLAGLHVYSVVLARIA